MKMKVVNTLLTNLREIRRKIFTTKKMEKIFKAMELIATSRINKAFMQLQSSIPYANSITRAVSELTSQTDISHPLINNFQKFDASIILTVSSNRGLCGNYNTRIINVLEGLINKLRNNRKQIIHFLVGKKILNYFLFQKLHFEKTWFQHSTEMPTFKIAKQISDILLKNFFLKALSKKQKEYYDIYIVYTKFFSRSLQKVEIVRLLPIEIVEKKIVFKKDIPPKYEFDTEPKKTFDYLLNRYIEHRIFNAMLSSAMSEISYRQKAMKTASENSHELGVKLKRCADVVRQNEITQEITEIINGCKI